MSDISLLGRYANGNYKCTLFSDGTKIRYNKLDSLIPEFPESIDLKITNRCDMNCPQCHEKSSATGKHSDIMNEKFIDTLHPYTELAIGGGNVLEHPDLVEFLNKCKDLKLIPSMTVNQKHFEENIEFIRTLVNEKLIYGIGISINNPTNELIELIKEFDNAILHVIVGIITLEQLKKIKDNGLKILFLGYKDFGRGIGFLYDNEDYIIENTHELYNNIQHIINDGWFETISFDNLGLKQLNPKRFMTEEEYENMYMGDDGSFTMYIDAVKRIFARNSTSYVRYPIIDNIISMFNIIRR